MLIITSTFDIFLFDWISHNNIAQWKPLINTHLMNIISFKSDTCQMNYLILKIINDLKIGFCFKACKWLKYFFVVKFNLLFDNKIAYWKALINTHLMNIISYKSNTCQMNYLNFWKIIWYKNLFLSQSRWLNNIFLGVKFDWFSDHNIANWKAIINLFALVNCSFF